MRRDTGMAKPPALVDLRAVSTRGGGAAGVPAGGSVTLPPAVVVVVVEYRGAGSSTSAPHG